MNQVAAASHERKRSLGAALESAGYILLFAVAFSVLQWLTFILRFPPYERTTIWTPGALLFTALLLTPPRQWWRYYLGLCLGVAVAYFGDAAIPVRTALLAAQCHYLAVAAGAWLLRRMACADPFGSPSALLGFFFLAVVLVPIMTSTPIDLVRLFGGAGDIWSVAVRSVLCIALGLLIGTPVLTLTLQQSRQWLRGLTGRRMLEGTALAVSLFAVDYLCFEQPAGYLQPALLYAPLPLLLWAATRFGVAGVSAALLAVAYQSTWGAIHGKGPFVEPAPADNVLQLQLFLLTIALPLMFLAAVIQQRGQAIAALSREIQERTKAEERFQLVVEATPNAIVMANTAGEIMLVNSQAVRLLGYLREELLGQPLARLLPERFRALHAASWEDFVADPSPRTCGMHQDWYVHGKHGGEIPVEIGMTPIYTRDGLFVLSVLVDLTARKKAEEAERELAHAARLALVGELTASIAHEINQPLGAILANADAAELLLDAAPDSLGEVRQILDDIRKDDLRASEVIRRLRSLLRKRELDKQSLHLNEIILEVVRLLGSEARRRGMNIETELDEALPPIRGDRVHMQQILLNLLLNGMEAMAEGCDEPRLTVRTLRQDDGTIEAAVSDTGPGIAPERLARLFEPFFTTKKEGMGLGLSIARSLVEAHGGRLRAENRPERGAVFRFTLPADQRRGT